VGMVSCCPPGPPVPRSAPAHLFVCAGTLPAHYSPFLSFPDFISGTSGPTVHVPTCSDGQDYPRLPPVGWLDWGPVRYFGCVFFAQFLQLPIGDDNANYFMNFQPTECTVSFKIAQPFLRSSPRPSDPSRARLTSQTMLKTLSVDGLSSLVHVPRVSCKTTVGVVRN